MDFKCDNNMSDMTSLRLGHKPLQITIVAFTSSSLKYIFSRGLAIWIYCLTHV